MSVQQRLVYAASRTRWAWRVVLTLRPYQTAAVSAAEDAEGRVLIVLPTGAGKTVCFAHLIAKRGGDALVLAHRDELLEQAAKKLVMVAPELGSRHHPRENPKPGVCRHSPPASRRSSPTPSPAGALLSLSR